jgi:methylated-DNA-[protein]-cysteine S-methyltransferase
MKTYKVYYQSPIGLIEITGTEEAIQAVDFVEKAGEAPTEIPPLLRTCLKQVEEYFQGKRKEFQLRLGLEGTDFQRRVWQELVKISYGETASYKGIAEAIANPKAMRAVGQANHRNPVAIIIPCHRVIGHDGSLTGYGGGLWRKEWLLGHEAKCMADN